jgi:hypothetical protein
MVQKRAVGGASSMLEEAPDGAGNKDQMSEPGTGDAAVNRYANLNDHSRRR